MAEINKIFPKSSVSIKSVDMTTLCFIDGLVVPIDKYSLTFDRFDIYKQSLESVNLFYNYNISNYYEYNLLLNNSGVIVSGLDIKSKNLSNEQNLDSDHVMIFVNGKLLSKDEYIANNSTKEITLLYTIPQNLFQTVSIYVSKNPITYKKIIVTDNEFEAQHNSTSTVLYVYNGIPTNPNIPTPNINDYINIGYSSINSSIIFINGKKLDDIYISSNGNSIKINKEIKTHTNVTEKVWNPVTQQYDIHTITYTGEGYSDSIEFYDLGSDTESVNFYNTLGFTTFNYKDSNQKRIPLLYNYIATFSDIAKYAVDNIKPGFFIKENSSTNPFMVVVDNNFETYSVKCYKDAGYGFNKSNYINDFNNNIMEYYLEAPDVKSITEYLADYDGQHKFLPSILEIFQQTLLKEIYDSISRIRDIRCIDRVDSYHINKLIKLLGMDVDIKTLSLKRRHELLEELNSWYRIVGTKDSLNIFNTLQDDIKLVQIDQLFTPSYNFMEPNAATYYSYSFEVTNGGTGYHLNDRLEYAYDIYGDQSLYQMFYFTVTGLHPDTSSISSVECTSGDEGNIDINQIWSTITPPNNNLRNQNLNLKTTITTTNYNIRYDYHYATTPTSQSGIFHVNDILYTTVNNNTYRFRVTSVNSNGRITAWTKLDGPEYGSKRLTISDLSLSVSSPTTFANTFTLKVVSTPNDTLLKSSTTDGYVSLPVGTYRYILHGAAGGGGAAFHRHTGWSYCYPGYTGQTVDGTFTVNSSTTGLYYVGTGGKGGWAKDHENSAGNGAGGTNNYSSWYSGNPGSGWGWWCWNHEEASAGPGGGGAATILKVNSTIYSARGGNGGDAKAWRWHTQEIITWGGTGGGGGCSSYGTAEGGAACNAWGWGGNGSNGYINIYTRTYSFNLSVLGSDNGVVVGDTFRTTNGFTIVVTSVNNGSITGFNVTQTPSNYGKFNIAGNYSLIYVPSGNHATFSVYSTFNNKYVRYSYGNLTGLTQYLYDGAVISGTIASTGYTTHPANTPITINVTGTIYNVNRNAGTFMIDWSPLELDTNTEFGSDNIIVTNFNNTPVNLYLNSGSGQVDISVISNSMNVTYAEQEYVDFKTMEELGAIPHIEYVGDNILDYGYITSAVQETFDYGLITSDSDITHLDYGYITDKVSGKWVKWYEWDRNPSWYPTNHVNVYIKIEATDDAEDIRNRFITQFYNLASTVLYIHRLIMCYYFGNSTVNVSSGITSLDQSPIFLGIQTTTPVTSESLTFTSDPNRQHNTNNLTCTNGYIDSITDSNGLIEYIHVV